MRQGKNEIYAERLVCSVSHAADLFPKIRWRTKLSLHQTEATGAAHCCN
jgi:hypothetical protein